MDFATDSGVPRAYWSIAGNALLSIFEVAPGMTAIAVGAAGEAVETGGLTVDGVGTGVPGWVVLGGLVTDGVV